MKKCIKIAYQSFSFMTCKALHNTKRRGKSTLSLCHCFSHSSFDESFFSSVLEDSFFSSFSSFLDGCSSFCARLARSPVINPAAAAFRSRLSSNPRRLCGSEPEAVAPGTAPRVCPAFGPTGAAETCPGAFVPWTAVAPCPPA